MRLNQLLRQCLSRKAAAVNSQGRKGPGALIRKNAKPRRGASARAATAPRNSSPHRERILRRLLGVAALNRRLALANGRQ